MPFNNAEHEGFWPADFEAYAKRSPYAAEVVPLVFLGGVDIRAGKVIPLYECRHLSATGECLIYETRPQMCRDHGVLNYCDRLECELASALPPIHGPWLPSEKAA